MPQPSAWQRITEFFTTNITTPIYGRVRSITRRWRSSFRQPTHDWGRSDYQYYARLYRGQVVGMELAGLLVKPIVSKLASWTLGRAPRWKLESETAQEALADWWNDNHPDVLRAWRAALKEGDSFLVINSDLSITLLPPDAVDPIVDDNDFGNILGWRVTQVLAHPETTARMTVEDEYYPERRIQRITIDGVRRDEQTYPNLMGRIPLIHIANQAGAGEVFGHPEAEALLPLLHRYGEVFDSAIGGNIRQGRPTAVLTFDTIQDLEKFDAENADYETETLPDGTQRRNKVYGVDLDELLVASGATFEYKSPGPFTEDTAQLLEIMFYLILEHSELPEFVFGNAISSSKASAEAQMPIFEKFVESRRGEMVGWLTEIAEIALGYLALITPGVNTEMPTLQWQPITQDDRMTLDGLTWAYTEGLIDRKTALQLAPFDIEDVDAVLMAADKEREERAAAFPETTPDERQFDSDLAAQIEDLEID